MHVRVPRNNGVAGWAVVGRVAPEQERTMTRLSNKAIIISGAGSGLGREYALASARAGARVVVNDVSGDAAAQTQKLITDEGGTAIGFVGSVASWDDARRMVEACVSEFGAIDGFVANAAIMHMGAPWDEEESRLRAIAEVNILGVQFGIRHAMRAMVDGGRGGSIVTIVSGAMHGMSGMGAYGASKGAVASMTNTWAVEGASQGIRVNAVSPMAMTKMTSDHLDQSHADPSIFRTPDAIAPVVVSLLSDDTADITGRLIRFDGSRVSHYETVVEVIDERPEWSVDSLTAALTARFPAATVK